MPEKDINLHNPAVDSKQYLIQNLVQLKFNDKTTLREGILFKVVVIGNVHISKINSKSKMVIFVIFCNLPEVCCL